MPASSQLGTVDAVPAVDFTYGQPPEFGRSVVVTAFTPVAITQTADLVKIFGNYTPTPAPFILFSQNVGVQKINVLGVIERLLLEAVTFDVTDDIVAGDRSIVRYLERQDPGSFPSNGQPLSAIQNISEYSGGTKTGGTWDMVFTMQDGSEVTVTHAWDDSFTEFQTNIDTVMAGEILSYAAGDIAVTNPSGGDIRLSFSGDSVKHLHWELVQVDETNLTGTGSYGAVTNIQFGHPARYGWSVLYILGVVETEPTPQMGVAPVSFNVNSPGSRADYPPQWVVRALAEEMSYVEDNIELKQQLFKELGIS